MSFRKTILRLALGLEQDPARAAEVEKHFRALHAAAVASADDKNEQDGLAMAEAVSMLLAQQLANMDAGHRRGILNYITQRTELHVPTVQKAGTGAKRVDWPDDD